MQSAVFWSRSLTDQNTADLKRVKSSALKTILGEKYQGYRNALTALNFETLEESREMVA